jgi:PAS domain S-box-containing protein
VVLDTEGRIQGFNKACELATGYRFDEVRGRGWWDLAPPDQVERVRALFALLRSGGFPPEHEDHWVGKDGSRLLIAWSNAAVRDAAGHVTALIATGIDVTQQRGAGAPAAASEARYQAIFEHTPVGIAVLDLEGQFVTSNRRLREILGRSAELDALDFVRISNAEDVSLDSGRVTRVLAGEIDCHAVEKRYARPDGRVVWINVTLSVVRGESGQPGFFMVSVEDITQRRQAEQARAESFELFRTAFRTSPEAFSINRVGDDAYLAVNDGFTRITGWSEHEILGRSSADIRIWAGAEEWARLLEVLQARGAVDNLEVELRGKHGQPIVGLMSACLTKMGAVPCVLSVVRDMTEWKRSQEDRRRLEEQLRQSQKMEATGRLAAGVAHDFNNILTAISSCGYFLQETLGADHPGRPDADEIVASTQRATALTRKLLSLGRRQRLAPRVLTLAEVVRGMEEMLRRTLGDGIALEVNVSAPGSVKADPSQLEMVVLNLAVNSGHAMPDGGRLTISVDELAADAPARPDDHGLPGGPFAVLSVRDTGTGMSEETRARIFEPFFTTKEAGKGTGLGLAMVYAAVTQSGGAIHVDSAPGKGTEMRVYLPVCSEEAEVVASAESGAVTGGAETILVVEDDPIVRALAVRMLGNAGYCLLEAASPSEALACSKRHGGPMHMLLSDVLLPEMDGWALSRRLLAERPGLGVLFMSGYAGDRLDGHAIIPVDVPMLQKPFAPDDLLRVVREVLDGVKACRVGDPFAGSTEKPRDVP